MFPSNPLNMKPDSLEKQKKPVDLRIEWEIIFLTGPI